MLAEVPDFSVESVFLRIFRQMKKSSRKIKEVMQMNIFETVKAAVTVRQAAEHRAENQSLRDDLLPFPR